MWYKASYRLLRSTVRAPPWPLHVSMHFFKRVAAWPPPAVADCIQGRLSILARVGRMLADRSKITIEDVDKDVTVLQYQRKQIERHCLGYCQLSLPAGQGSTSQHHRRLHEQQHCDRTSQQTSGTHETREDAVAIVRSLSCSGSLGEDRRDWITASTSLKYSTLMAWPYLSRPSRLAVNKGNLASALA